MTRLAAALPLSDRTTGLVFGCLSPEWKDRIMRGIARLMVLILAPLLLFAACQREGTAERTGRSIDRGVERLTR